MKIKSILIIFLLLFLTGCDTSANTEEELDNYCMITDFKDESNIFDICEELYDSYDSYYGGNIEEYLRTNRIQSINSCIDSFYISFENYKYNYTEGCGDFITGSGGYGELYPSKDFRESLTNWCENNYYINEKYFNCIGR